MLLAHFDIGICFASVFLDPLWLLVRELLELRHEKTVHVVDVRIKAPRVEAKRRMELPTTKRAQPGGAEINPYKRRRRCNRQMDASGC